MENLLVSEDEIKSICRGSYKSTVFQRGDVLLALKHRRDMGESALSVIFHTISGGISMRLHSLRRIMIGRRKFNHYKNHADARKYADAVFGMNSANIVNYRDS